MRVVQRVVVHVDVEEIEEKRGAAEVHDLYLFLNNQAMRPGRIKLQKRRPTRPSSFIYNSNYWY